QRDLAAHGGDLHLGQRQPQVLHRADAALHAVADEPGRLVVPLRVQEVDRVLQRRGHGVVVLGGDEDEPVEGADGTGPAAGLLVAVVAEYGGQGLVEQRQLVLGEVDDLEGRLPCGDGRVPGGHFGDPPGRDLRPAGGPGAADDDGDLDHACSPHAYARGRRPQVKYNVYCNK